jgi:hypothetical protein
LELDGGKFFRLSSQQKEGWIAAKRALLQRVAPLIRALMVYRWHLVTRSDSWELTELLSPVCEQRLTSLELQSGDMPLSVASMLGRMPRLPACRALATQTWRRRRLGALLS